MTAEMMYVQSMYNAADISGNTDAPGAAERARFNTAVHNKKIDDEMHWLFEEQQATEAIWGVHSIWIRLFPKRYADLTDATCAKAAKKKIMNTGILHFDIIRKDWTDKDGVDLKYQAINCAIVYLDTEPGDYEWENF